VTKKEVLTFAENGVYSVVERYKLAQRFGT